MERLNCWQVQQCGREPGGENADLLGVCPASTEERLDGVHGGTNGGRACWVVAGSLGRTESGCSCESPTECHCCSFYLSVIEEELPDIVLTPRIVELLHGAEQQ